MSNQPYDDSRLDTRELMATVAERLDGVKEQFSDFRAETRGNFDATKQQMAELKAEVKSDALAIREEMRTGFRQHDQRITSLEQDRERTRGGLGFGRWIIGAFGAMASIAAWLVGKNA